MARWRYWMAAGTVLAAGLVAGMARADDWAQFRRDAQRTGASKDAVPPPLVEIWSHGVAPNSTARAPRQGAMPMSTAAVFQDRIFFVAGSHFAHITPGRPVRTLFSADARTGVPFWRQPIGGARVNPLMPEDVGPVVSPSGAVFVWDTMDAGPLVEAVRNWDRDSHRLTGWTRGKKGRQNEVPPTVNSLAMPLNATLRDFSGSGFLAQGPKQFYSLRAFRGDDGAPAGAMPLVEYPRFDPRGPVIGPRLLLLDGHGDADQIVPDPDQYSPGTLVGWVLRRADGREVAYAVGHPLVAGNDVYALGARDVVMRWNPAAGLTAQVLRLLHPMTAFRTGGPLVLATHHAAPRFGGFPMALARNGVVVGEGATDPFLTVLSPSAGGWGGVGWHADLPWMPGVPSVGGPSIFLGIGAPAGHRAIVAIDSASGAVRWGYPPAGVPGDPGGMQARAYNNNRNEVYKQAQGRAKRPPDISGFSQTMPSQGTGIRRKEPIPWSIEGARARWTIRYMGRGGVGGGGGGGGAAGRGRGGGGAAGPTPRPRRSLMPTPANPQDFNWGWHHGATGAQAHAFNPGLVVAGGCVYGVVQGPRAQRIVALDEASGRVVWEQPVKERVTVRSLAATPEHLYVSTNDGLYALQPKDGQLVWSTAQQLPGALAVASRLLFLSTSRSLHAYAPAERTFRLAVPIDDLGRLSPEPGGRLAPDPAPERLMLDSPPRETPRATAPPAKPDAQSPAPVAPAAESKPAEPKAAAPKPAPLADAALIRLSADRPPAELLGQARRAARAAGESPLLVSLDWLDAGRVGLVPGGPSATWTPQRTETFARTCGELAAAAKPAWFDIGPDVNVYLTRYPQQAAAVTTLLQKTCAAVRTASPETKVLVSFNAEVANGTYGRTNVQPYGVFPRGWKPDVALMRRVAGLVDALGVTSRPQSAAGSVGELAGNHLLFIRQQIAGEKPVLVTRTVVRAKANVPLAGNTAVPYLRRMLQLCYWLDAALVVYPEVELEGSGELAAVANDPAHPALGVWDDVRAWKPVTTLSAAPGVSPAP